MGPNIKIPNGYLQGANSKTLFWRKLANYIILDCRYIVETQSYENMCKIGQKLSEGSGFHSFKKCLHTTQVLVIPNSKAT